MQKKCHICQSERIIPELQIWDHGDTEMQVVMDTKPHAALFKGWRRSKLRAWACVDCEHVEFYIENLEDLYDAYLQKQATLAQE